MIASSQNNGHGRHQGDSPMQFRARTVCLALALSLALGLGTARAQTVEITGDLAKVVEGARQEGRLVLRSTTSVNGAAEGAKIAQDGIKRMFGVDLAVEWVPGPAFAPLAAALYQEKQANQPASGDVFVATPIQITPYLDRGLFQAVDWVKLVPARIRPEFIEGDGKAIRFMTFLPGINYNVKVATWVPQINVLEDVLKPEHKGKFVTTPFLAGFDVLLADPRWGPKRTEEFVRRMSAQIAGLLGCEGEDRIASGETPALVIDCSGGSQNRLRFRGKNILATHIVSDVAQRRYAYMTVPAHTPHPNAAILYTLYISSPEGQEKVVWDLYGWDLDLYPGAHAGKRVQEAESQGVKFTDVTIDWWKTNQGVAKDHLELTKIIREK
jgi:ABC-type Fe3+ transport system substrate-binding protein